MDLSGKANQNHDEITHTHTPVAEAAVKTQKHLLTPNAGKAVGPSRDAEEMAAAGALALSHPVKHTLTVRPTHPPKNILGIYQSEVKIYIPTKMCT